jgi:hypothetical protein
VFQVANFAGPVRRGNPCRRRLKPGARFHRPMWFFAKSTKEEEPQPSGLGRGQDGVCRSLITIVLNCFSVGHPAATRGALQKARPRCIPTSRRPNILRRHACVVMVSNLVKQQALIQHVQHHAHSQWQCACTVQPKRIGLSCKLRWSVRPRVAFRSPRRATVPEPHRIVHSVESDGVQERWSSNKFFSANLTNCKPWHSDWQLRLVQQVHERIYTCARSAARCTR